MEEKRKERNLSQRKLAKKSKVSQTHISEIENELERPSLDMIEKLAHGLKIDPMELMESYKPRRKK